MAKLAMRRMEIVALLKDSKKIIEWLQRRGVMEFSDCRDEELIHINTATFVSHFDAQLNLALQAKGILDEYAPAKTSLLAAFSGKREMEKHLFGQHADQSDRYLNICREIVDTQKQITEHKAAMVRLQTLMDALAVWDKLDIPLQFQGTRYTRCFIGVFPGQRTAGELLVEIATRKPELELITLEVVASYKEMTCGVVICHKEAAAETAEVLRELGFQAPSDKGDELPRERLERYQAELAEHQRAIDQCVERIVALADRRQDLEFLIDYLRMRKDKYDAISRTAMTRHTIIITGYIPEKYAAACAEELERRFTAAVSIHIPAEDEDVPVLLENNRFAAPMESITEMYALPGKRDIDPSAVMAFFYYAFFGIMLSDAGYGLIMTIGSAIALKKLHLKDSMRKTLRMFFYCGLSTVFWGALFGSWFGDIVQVIFTEFLHKPAPSLALWFEPISDPITFLLAAFGFGIIHLFVGLGVSFKMLWDQGRKWDAIWDVIPVCLLVLGAAPLAAGFLAQVPAWLTQAGQYSALAGLVLIILTNGRSAKNIFARLGLGLYGLYGIASGYLSDILSYSRLLALGLATGSIGSVFNMLGTLPQNPVLKGVMLTLIFLIGHPLNMAINVLGAYVHTNRLQFVEFFSKFYEGGGRAFHPLKIDTEYINIKETV